MDHRVAAIIKSCVPPILLGFNQRREVEPYGYSGNYSSWEEARGASEGYDSDVILDKVKTSLLKVKSGEAVYERDSVLFDTVQHSWPLLASLFWVASSNGNRLNLIDFGGSLGSTYYQNKKFLASLNELRWSIVEQEKFVTCGKQFFEDEQLKFYHDIEDCCNDRRPHAILLSSVIQYLEDPYAMLQRIREKRFPFIIFDRTSFLVEGGDRITVQVVPPHIYPASYPAWFFNREKFVDFFSGSYELVAGFTALGGVFDIENGVAKDEGLVFRLRQ